MQGFKPRLRTILHGFVVLLLAGAGALAWPSVEAQVLLFFCVPAALVWFLYSLALDVSLFSLAKYRGSVDSWEAFRISDGVALVVTFLLVGVMFLLTPKMGGGERPFWFDLGINPFLVIIPAIGLMLVAMGWPLRSNGHAGRAILMSGVALLLAGFVSFGIELATRPPAEQQVEVSQPAPDPFICKRTVTDGIIQLVCTNSKGEQASGVSTHVIRR
jgi:hypothetical protein